MEIIKLANIKRKTLQALCKELKRFDEATHRQAVENSDSFRFRFIRIVARRLKITKFTSNKKH